eukprot:scaffold1782_cov414-Prasinococcus_capsulatus_cf.AAC.16
MASSAWLAGSCSDSQIRDAGITRSAVLPRRSQVRMHMSSGSRVHGGTRHLLRPTIAGVAQCTRQRTRDRNGTQGFPGCPLGGIPRQSLSAGAEQGIRPARCTLAAKQSTRGPSSPRTPGAIVRAGKAGTHAHSSTRPLVRQTPSTIETLSRSAHPRRGVELWKEAAGRRRRSSLGTAALVCLLALHLARAVHCCLKNACIGVICLHSATTTRGRHPPSPCPGTLIPGGRGPTLGGGPRSSRADVLRRTPASRCCSSIGWLRTLSRALPGTFAAQHTGKRHQAGL